MNLAAILSVALLQPEPVIPTLSVQPDKIDLGETTNLTLAVEGPAPLRIDMPNEAEKLLSPKSVLMWQIKPLGPPRRTPQGGGRERWEQTFRLSPYFHGDRVLLAINSLNVNGSQVTFEAQSIRVRKTIEEAKAENAVPVTGIEQLPPVAVPPADPSGWPFIALICGVFAIMLAVVLVRKSRAVPPPIPPNEWAERELQNIERDMALGRVDDRIATERVAAILREYVERRFALPATRLTTSELYASCIAAQWPAVRASDLHAMLTNCDQAKFSGVASDPSGMLLLTGLAVQWVEECRPDPAASLHSPT